MPAFSVTPLTDVPPPQAAEFPDFIQFQDDGTDLGLADADTLNFGSGLTATRGIGENSNVVTVTAGVAAASYGLIGLVATGDFIFNFSGLGFVNWTASVTIANASWGWDTGTNRLQFVNAGVYRVTATCSIQAGGGAWPAGTSFYGSQADVSTATQSRYHAEYDIAEQTTTMQWTDQHVLSVATALTTVELALFASAATTDYPVAAASMSLVIERLGDYPA